MLACWIPETGHQAIQEASGTLGVPMITMALQEDLLTDPMIPEGILTIIIPIVLLIPEGHLIIIPIQDLVIPIQDRRHLHEIPVL